MREDEAKHKWCPFARVKDVDRYGKTAVNRSETGLAGNSKCLASGCMAWREEAKDLGGTRSGRCGLVP